MASFNKVRVKKLYLPSQTAGGNGGQRSVLVTASAEDLNALVGAATSGTNGLLLSGAYTNSINLSGTATTHIVMSGAATTGVSITGTVSKGIDVTDGTLTQAWTNAWFACGSGNGSSGDQHSVTTTGFYIPIQVNMVSIANPANISEFGAAMLRADVDTVDQGKVSCDVLMLRSDVAKNVYATTCINASLNISDDIAVPTATVQGIFVQISGAKTITCPNEISVLEARYSQTTGGGGVDYVGSFVNNGSGCTITSIVNVAHNAGTCSYGVNIKGTYGTSALQVGTDAAKLSLTTDAVHGVDVHTTSPDAAGNHFANRFYHTNTAGTTGGHFTMWVQNTVGAAGAGHGCMYIKLDCATFDAPTGGNSALNVEMVLPNKTHGGGSYHPFVIDVDAGGASLVMHGNAGIPCSFMKLEAYGASVAEWNTKASLFTLSGVTDTTDGMFEAEAVGAGTPTVTHVLRINISGTYYYLALNTAKTFNA